MINNIPVGTIIKYIGGNLWIAKYKNEYSAIGTTPDIASKLLEYNIINYIRDIKIELDEHIYKDKQ